MKKIYLFLLALFFGVSAFSQDDGIKFDPSIDVDFSNLKTVQVPESPIQTQVLFSEGVDSVTYVNYYGETAGFAPAKGDHDFIGITPDDDGGYWITVNHESRETNTEIGDGGGMTTFKVVRNTDGNLKVVKTTMPDNREGYYHNVDFVNKVGPTWTNCGGIIAPDGRIWTAEEYPRVTSWGQGNEDVMFLKDTGDVVIGEGYMVPFNNAAEPVPGFKGERLKKFENQGWMVEIDPETAKAIRKQYNWGRMSFEAGCMMPDMKTVYFAEDERPGLFTKFVADEAGDFTSGKLYVFKQDGGDNGNWLEVDNSDLETMVNLKDWAWQNGATYFIRLEWLTEINGKVYIAETGYDNVNKKSSWQKAIADGSVDQVAYHHQDRATAQGTQFVTDDATHYYDYYGRVLEFDPATDEISVYLEGGPEYAEEQSQAMSEYPGKHLSNPDGLGKIKVGDKWYMILNEDLNGSSHNRLPGDFTGWACEMYALDMSIENPTIDDLVRVAVGPNGSELTGGNGTQDGRSILVDIQHPSGSNTPPYNHASTVAINGFSNIEELHFDIDWTKNDVLQTNAYEGVTEESEFINDSTQLFAGERLKKFENQGWMVEIDPETAKAIRKQYNWGRMSFEAGCMMPDMKTVYFAEDERPGLFTKFVADEAGDFTSGKLYVFKQDGGDNGNWLEVDNSDLETMVNLKDWAWQNGATYFIRLEWLTEINGKVYIAETGYDNVNKKSSWQKAIADGSVDQVAYHHQDRATAQGTQFVTDDATHYYDYYGRVLEFDPATDEISVYLEGGPEYAEEQSQNMDAYPAKHLSNPDGLGKIQIDGKWYLILNEDLNGSSHNRLPGDFNGWACEMYALDMSIENPTIDDLVRVAVGPNGSELTGGNGTQDGKSILVDIQHPSSSNTPPYDHASTIAINNFSSIEDLDFDIDWAKNDVFQSKYDKAVTTETEFINDSTQLFAGERLKRFESQGWMVEIDPATAKAIRKQYNWGRMSFEAGCMMPDMKTVYFAEDERPGLFTKFVADEAGDFTSGKLYVYKQDGGTDGNWLEVDNSDLETMVNMKDTAWTKGATYFIRLEWLTEIDGKVYIAETGYDNVNKKTSWQKAIADGSVDQIAYHHQVRATAQGTQFETNDETHYYDYYGRILEYDPVDDTMRVYLEGGPEFAEAQSDSIHEYPSKHLSNPDGLGKIQVDGKWYLILNEDLNGSSHNRLPGDFNGWACEMYALDMSIENPTVDDLVRIAVGPNGAELTGGNGTQDGKSILVDIQHPSSSNDAPYNHASTIAINNFETIEELDFDIDWSKNAMFQTKEEKGVSEGSAFINDSTQLFTGERLKKFESQGWMVEIDPATAKAIRKQYNWGRMSFEAGCMMPDMKTVYFAEDERPGLFTKFVADEAGDFTSGKLYVYKQDGGTDGNWLEVDNSDLETMVNMKDTAWAKGATYFIRLEWLTEIDGKVYIAETGYDNVNKKSSWQKAIADGSVDQIAYHHQVRATAQGTQFETNDETHYYDYYGRILEYDPVDDTMRVYLEGGPEFAEAQSDSIHEYPSKHLSNPDGLGKVNIDGNWYLVINEDLNGASYNRLPSDFNGWACEMYLLDMQDETPTIDELIRIGVGPNGSELTGGNGTQDGKSILVDIQHPSSSNPAPYNHASTMALTGFDQVADITTLNFDIDFSANDVFQAPTASEIHTQMLFSGTIDSVTVLDTDRNPDGLAPSKEGHDFIGISQIDADNYWISVNHETRNIDHKIGDGGGMTSFQVTREANTDTFQIVTTTLTDGRDGKFHNVDFVNTVGETWTNCGGIIAPDGRIWTAEEYPLIESWGQGNNNINFVRNMNDVIIGEGTEIDKTQVLFSGTVDNVQTLDTYGQPNGEAPAKEGHDFIGISELMPGEYLISVNHETRNMNEKIGDGGAMTSFMIKNVDGQYEVMEQTLADGRDGKFFNVDFVNTVGETWTNCGGIIAPDGRIWTAEEYPLIESWGQGNEDVEGFITNMNDVIIGEGVESSLRQTLFSGTVDMVQTLDTYRQPNGEAPAKEGHDFIGISEIQPGEYLISVNHETRSRDKKIGDGGAMTSFKIKNVDGQYVIMDQELPDGREGKFFNVDFVNTVGETWTNCGGIIAPDGRIWTAEEYPLIESWGQGNNDISYISNMNDIIIGEGQVMSVRDQVLFSGTVDSVQTVDFYGLPNGSAPAKEDHDFIGITPAETGSYFLSINHESREINEKIGDGGGMTTFKVTRNNEGDFEIMEQTLADGRSGKFFNVDFVNTVGETWTNCGGIIAPDGRIWTAEEYPRMESWGQGNEDVTFLSDTGDVIIGEGIMVPFNNPAEPAAFDGERLKAFEGQGWMVEIDPMTGEAIRKQYNWGRMSFEAGCIMPDNKTVFLAEDERPGILVKFVADNAGDFTSGKLYAFKQDGGDEGNWVELDNSNMEEMINMKDTAWAKSATLFIRLEWITEIDGKVYICETGYDNVNKKSSWTGAVAIAGEDAIADHHKERATDQGTQFTVNDDTHYYDYYGRILVYDPETDEVSVFLEGGPDYAEEQSQTMSEYPAKHLSNPDGLGKIQVNGKWYLIINEDLNGSSYNRLPSDAAGWGCEMYIIDPDIENPTIDDLTRIMVGPNGAELTGGNGTPDGKTILVDIQHPSGSNDAPYNKAVTVALNGFDTDVVGIEDYMDDSEDAFVIYPNPVYQTLYFNGTFDVELFDALGTLIKQKENTGHLNISELKPGVYYIRNNEGVIKKLIKN